VILVFMVKVNLVVKSEVDVNLQVKFRSVHGLRTLFEPEGHSNALKKQ
jgi:hypothetical protein